MVLLACAVVPAAEAAQGDPDPSWGSSGVAQVPGTARLFGQGAPLVQSDGRVVAVSLLPLQSNAIFLSRFKTDGTADTTFGTSGGGTNTTVKAGLLRAATALAPDGKIVVAGGPTLGGTLTVGRFTANGAPDTTFNRTGVATLNLKGNVLVPTSALVQPDGKVLVTIVTDIGGKWGLTVVRFTAAGALDTAFGGAGKGYQQVIFTGKAAGAFDVARQADGKLVVAGALINTSSLAPLDSALARLNADGTLDTSFGTGGRVTRDLSANGGSDGATALTLGPTGAIFVAGPSGSSGMVAKLTSTGAPDAGFGTAGVVSTALAASGTRFVPADLALDAAGRLVLTGSVLDGGTLLPRTRWGVVRLQASGASPLDATFALGGRATLTACSNPTLQGPSGITPVGSRLLVAGSCGLLGQSTVVRLLAGAAFPDTATLAVSPRNQAAGHETVSLTNLDPATVLGAGSTLQGTPFRSSPFRSSPFRSSPFRSSPFRSSPFRSSPITLALPDTVLLSELPLAGTTWEAVLAGTPLAQAPLQSITLRQVLDLSPAPAALSALTMADVDLADTPLKDVSLAALLLSPIPAASLPNASPAWPAGSTLLSLELSGVNLTSYYAQGISLRGLPLGTGANRAVLANIPIGDVDLADTPFAGVSLTGITDVGQLIARLPIAGGPADVTLGQLLLGLVGSADIPFERTPLRSLLDAADRRATRLQDYTASFRVDCAQGGTVAADLTLPGDARFTPGSATVSLDGGAATALANPTGTGPLTFALATACPAGNSAVRAVVLRFKVEPGSSLGPDQASVTVRSAGGSGSPTTAPVTVDDNTRPADSPTLTPGALRTGHLSSSGDVDTFTIAAPPVGSRLTVTLAHLPADYDLVVAGPATDDVADSPFRSSPFRSSPFRSSPVPDASDEPTDPSIVSPNAVQDVPFRSSSARGVSVKRGTADESVTIVSRESDQGGSFTVRVAGFDGASSPDPYVIRSAVVTAPAPPACLARTGLSGGTAGTLPSAADVPDDARTLILVDQQRMGALYGSLATMRAKLDDYAARSEVQGVVLPVEGGPGVSAAYGAWDADPCSVPKANAVADAITGVIADVRDANGGLPQLRNVVVVGPDIVIPQLRVPDESRLANESTFADDDVFGGRDDAVSRALREGYMLTDDAYGDFDPQSLGARALYVPDVALGRLVESPADVVRALDAYTANNGVVSERSGFVAGYDFLKDGSQAVFDGLQPLFTGGTLENQINDAWSAPTGLGGINRTTAGISSVNAHFDTHRALPAAAFSGSNPALITAEQANVNAQTLLFSMGCHAGLNLSGAGLAGVDPTDARFRDWTQQVAGQGALWVANTGFGLGDSVAVAYSEKLMGRFADFVGRQDSSIGQSLMFAKQDYAATALALLDDYDVKALQETTFYGLPTYTTDDGTTAPPVQVPNSAARPAARALLAGQADSETFSFDATNAADYVRHDGARGAWWSYKTDEPLVIQRHPIQPRADLDVTPADGIAVHGVLLDSLQMREITPVNPVIARPTVDLAAHEPEPPGSDVSFPASLAAVWPVDTPQGRRERLTLNTGQFRSEGGGTQRLYERMSGRTLRSTSTDWDPPQIRSVDTIFLAGTVSFGVDAPGGSGGVVLFRTDASGDTWRSVALAPAGGDRLGATAALNGGTRVVEWIAQVSDDAGNVGISTNKVLGYAAAPLPAPAAGAPRATLSAPPESGFYDGSPTITLDRNGHDVAFEFSADGDPWQPYSAPFTIGGDSGPADGAHIVRFRGADDSTAVTGFVVDTSDPSITGAARTAPNANGWYRTGVTVDFTCADAGSGIASCSGPQTFTEDGTFTASGSATDRVGRSASVDVGPIRIDRTAPDVSIDGDGPITLTGEDQLTGNVTDAPSGVDSVVVRYSRPSEGGDEVVRRDAEFGEGNWTAPRPPDGTWTAVAIARDLAGNETTSGEHTVISQSQPDNLIVNGSFETPVVPFGNHQIFAPGTLPGWTSEPAREGTTSSGIEVQNHSVGSGDPADGAGNQYMEVDSDGPTRVSQTVTVKPSTAYRFSFIYSPRLNTPADENHMEVFVTPVDGSGTFEIGPLAGGPVNDWGHGYSIDFFTLPSQTSVEVGFRDLGPQDAPGTGEGMYVDQVSLVEVPDS